MDDVEPFNISVVDGGKKIEQVKGGVEVTAVVTYKNTFVVNGKLVTVFLTLEDGVACNTIFNGRFCRKLRFK